MVQIKQTYFIKILMIGDSDVGKTSLVHCLIEEKFGEKPTSTIGVDFKSKFIKLKDNFIKLQIWDTAGLERFRTLTKSYYKIANGIILVFDVGNADSFNNIKIWMDQIINNCNENVSLALVGNKIDLEDRKVSSNIASKFAKDNNMKYYETSSMKIKNVENLFFSIAIDIINQINNTETLDSKNYERIILQKSTTIISAPSKNKNCCE